ncbi:hypothetical protein KC19_2G063600 [Ceratodon purpureus]|uniref:Secreted protein n=1 Tax=Ceratodon purpureus TaxID=3225 RepID=A0A8T0IUN9_CERPU|nr:hypothetical protein KC19_2G063600 [Ceratodon purpureus]
MAMAMVVLLVSLPASTVGTRLHQRLPHGSSSSGWLHLLAIMVRDKNAALSWSLTRVDIDMQAH